MSETITSLQKEIAQLEQAIVALAGLPDSQKPLQEKLSEKLAALAKLTGQSAHQPGGNTTTIQGDVTGSVLSGTFSAPVHVGGSTINHGPVVSGPVQAGRDVNVAGEQTIVNRGDSIRVGDINNSSGIAVGRGAQATGGNLSGVGNSFSNISGSNINVGSTLSNVIQSIGAASHLDQSTADQLKQLIAALSAELQKHADKDPVAVGEVVKRTETAVAEATKPTPDVGDVTYSLERLQTAATNVGKLIPTVLPIAGQVIDFIRKMVGL
jgi:hypothetical protein